jgi:hypothetical protein
VAGYGTFTYTAPGLDLQAGWRTERLRYGPGGALMTTTLAHFPTIGIGYRHPESGSTVRVRYRRSARFPHLYHVNAVPAMHDPLYASPGSASLRPEFRRDANVEYARTAASLFVSVRLFHTHIADAIQSIGILNGDGLFEAGTFNAGEMRQAGVQVSGSFSPASRAGVQPFLRVFEAKTMPGANALEFGARAVRAMAYEAGLSAYAVLPAQVTASVQFHYASPVPAMQRSDFSGALYFVSVERMFGHALKLGVVSGLPFARSFTYQGWEIDGPAFQSRSEGRIQMSAVPVWFRLGYQMASGNRRELPVATTEDEYAVVRRGF